MIDYVTVEDEGVIRACFNQGFEYFEIPITDIPEDQIQDHLVQVLATFPPTE